MNLYVKVSDLFTAYTFIMKSCHNYGLFNCYSNSLSIVD